MIQEQIDALFRHRLDTIEDAAGGPTKVVGYFPGGYVPEELIHASGAIPICLSHGGRSATAEAALSLLPQVICPFARQQLGEFLLNTSPYYSSLDLIVAPPTCVHLRKLADILEYSQDVDVFKLGVPYDLSNPNSLAYYKERLADLRGRLIDLTGRAIDDASLTQSISLYNRMRELLRTIGLMRRTTHKISTLDFIRLNQASLYCDPFETTDTLALIHGTLLESREDKPSASPRVLIMGPNLGLGDYDVLGMLERVGADVVLEDFFEGVRDYSHTIPIGNDPLDDLTHGYLLNRRPAVFMRASARARVERVLRLIDQFAVAGVVWYQLVCCEMFDEEAYLFQKALEDSNIPLLVLESAYGDLQSGAAETRAEAFMEMLRGGAANA